MVYHLTRDGQSFGPYTTDDLRRYVAQGNVLQTDLVRAGDDSPWLTVAQVLAGNTALPPSPYTSAAPYLASPYAQANAGPERLYPLFPVSMTKFIVMSLCTFGLYQVYWSYRHWKRIQAETGESMMPVARAIFLGIWNFSLFDRVRTRAQDREIPVGWNPIALGVCVLLFGISSRLPGAISVLVLVSFLAYLPVVATIGKINARDAAEVTEPPNTSFSAWNIAGIVFGGLFLILAILGIIGQATGTLPR